MTTITHHPDEATLLSYAAGSLLPVLALAVASHADGCTACTAELRDFDSLGAALIAALPGAALDRDPPQLALRALEADVAEIPSADEVGAGVPVPLQVLVGPRLDEVRWRRLTRHAWYKPIELPRSSAGDLRLMRWAPGATMTPPQRRAGTLILVLQGGFADRSVAYRTSDLVDLGSDVLHRPVADDGAGCICLVASERPATFAGRLREWLPLPTRS